MLRTYHLSLDATTPLISPVPALPCVWLSRAELTPGWQQATRAALSASEITRFNQLAESKQAEYLSSRALLRLALSVCFTRGFSPASLREWQFDEVKDRAPSLQTSPTSKIQPTSRPIHFSLSHHHSEGAHYCAVALAGFALGVDIEKHRSTSQHKRIAARLFSDEQCAALEKAPEKRPLFFRFWTQKEAAYKLRHAQNQPMSFFSSQPLPDDIRLMTFQQNDFSLSLAQPASTSVDAPHLLDVTFKADSAVCVETMPNWEKAR